MDWKAEWKSLVLIVALFLAMFYLPVGRPRFDGAVLESLQLVNMKIQIAGANCVN